MAKSAETIKNAEDTSGSQRNRRKKSSRKRSRSRSEQRKDTEESEVHAEPSTLGKRKKSKKPLNGMVLSVSTFSEKNDNEGGGDIISFNSVCDTCKAMGAVTTSQISKRVQLLICTPSAVKQATQRVRKAFKKNVPIVSIDWLEACKKEGQNMPLEDFLLDEDVKDAIEKRATILNKEKSDGGPGDEALRKQTEGEEPGEDAGWSEPKDLGCCCVCHENGSEKDCKWCVDCK